jgi:hypothetical protein
MLAACSDDEVLALGGTSKLVDLSAHDLSVFFISGEYSLMNSVLRGQNVLD